MKEYKEQLAELIEDSVLTSVIWDYSEKHDIKLDLVYRVSEELSQGIGLDDEGAIKTVMVVELLRDGEVIFENRTERKEPSSIIGMFRDLEESVVVELLLSSKLINKLSFSPVNVTTTGVLQPEYVYYSTKESVNI